MRIRSLTCHAELLFINSKLDFSHVGSAVNQLTAPMISDRLIAIPPFPEQKAIAKVLSTLDSKIELNNQMNATLESMAQAIFKHWFIDFEFPDENGKPYKSSGGKMVDSKLGSIPEEWKVGKLKDIIAFKRDKFKQSTEWNHKKLISLSHMLKFSMCVNNFGEGSELNTNIYKLDEYDLLYGSIRPYFGKAGFSPIDGAVAGTVFQFIPNKKEYFGFALLILTSIDFINYTVANSKGTKMPIIDKDDILNYSIIIPSNILNDFNSIVLSLIIRMKNNISQNQILSSIRDSLLPKLMSGQIRVPVEVIKNA